MRKITEKWDAVISKMKNKQGVRLFSSKEYDSFPVRKGKRKTTFISSTE